jgi:beta-xylosidase
MLSPEGFLRLNCRPYDNIYEAQNIIAQKITAPKQTITAKVRFTAGVDGDRAGMVIHGRDYATISLVRSDGKLRLVQTICKGADKGLGERVVEEKNITPKEWMWLRVEIVEGAKCRFFYSLNGKRWEPLWEEFTAKEGLWIGAKWGLFAVTSGKKNDHGRMDIDWVRVE